MEIIKLNLIPSGVNPTCHCSQYDNGRVIRIDLFDGLTPYVLQSGDTVTLNVRKPDNTIVTASLTATQGNTYVNLVTTEQICACVGYNLCDLTIANGSTVIGTLNFIMQIERDVLADGVASQSVIKDLNNLVAEAVDEDLGDNYYNKTQTDEKITALIDDTEAQANKTYSSNKIGNLLSDKASIQENQGINLYNKNASGIKSGYYITSSGDETTANYCEISDFTEVKPLTTYAHRYEDYMGVKSTYFNLYDENKQFISVAYGTNTDGVVTITTTATTKYIKYNVRISNRDTFMLSEGSTIPPYYIAYVSPFFSLDSAISIPNKMFKKIAIFDGDSIGAGNSVGQSDPTYGQGWAGRIGIPNHMNWHNYCVAGGTITYVDNNRHCISRDIDKIHSEYPTLDYLILEGGTNDADFQVTKSSIDMTDYYGNYDDTTFCGAVETLFYKALNYYPYAKIGFIIAPKMGYTTSVGFYEGNRRREYFELIIEACKKWSIPYLDLWNDGQLNPMIPSMFEYGATVEENIARGSVYTDGQHLTAKGYDVITPKIEAFMRSL